MLIDTHAHLEFFPINSTESNDLSIILSRAYESGVSKIITIGSTLESSREAIEIAEKKSSEKFGIWATTGIHPTDSKEELVISEQLGLKIEKLKKIARSSKKVVAIGECGLDYFLSEDEQNKKTVTSDEEKDFQKKLFLEQIKLAAELNLPLVVHCRNAWDDVFEILERHNFRNGVFHSFTGGPKEADRAIKLGFYISFSGIVTFKNADKLKDAAKIVPIEKILVETDSPFLAPEPLRGQTNESRNVKITATFLAKLREIPEESFFRKTSENAKKLFNL